MVGTIPNTTFKSPDFEWLDFRSPLYLMGIQVTGSNPYSKESDIHMAFELKIFFFHYTSFDMGILITDALKSVNQIPSVYI